MSWEKAAHIATVIGTIVVIISVILIWRQLKQQAKLTKAANSQALVDISSPFNMELISNKTLAEIWFKGPQEFESYDDLKKMQVKSSLIWWVIFYENIFLQHEEGLLDSYIYYGWNKDLENFIERQDLNRHWDSLKEAYHPKFRMHVNDIITEHLKKNKEMGGLKRTEKAS